MNGKPAYRCGQLLLKAVVERRDQSNVEWLANNQLRRGRRQGRVVLLVTMNSKTLQHQPH